MGVLFNKKQSEPQANLPVHIGIIMDGNGRWAQKRGLPRTWGHKPGAKNFRSIVKHCSRLGIKYLTVYAFSTENWSRPNDEVIALMRLFEQYLVEALSDFKDENIKVQFLGEMEKFSPKIQSLIKKVESSSQNRSGMVLNIAMNYGGKSEIVNAAKVIAQKVVKNEIQISEITESLFSNYLYTSGQPEVDLVIRTGGEYRTSNFLIWQAAYSEYAFTDILWPDFKLEDLDNILILYAKRQRRFGGV
jgi:undecaprenyl diphosphate synthase